MNFNYSIKYIIINTLLISSIILLSKIYTLIYGVGGYETFDSTADITVLLSSNIVNLSALDISNDLLFIGGDVTTGNVSI